MSGRPPQFAQHLDAMRQMASDGKSSIEIAAHFGCSAVYVRKACAGLLRRRGGIPDRKPEHTPLRRHARLLILHSLMDGEGFTRDQVRRLAKRLGVSIRTIDYDMRTIKEAREYIAEQKWQRVKPD